MQIYGPVKHTDAYAGLKYTLNLQLKAAARLLRCMMYTVHREVTGAEGCKEYSHSSVWNVVYGH